MHELGITQSIVEACCERAGDARVARVTVEIGCLCAVLPDAVRFCYDVCTQGTPLEGSTIEIIAVPGRGQCRDCGHDMVMLDWFTLCACGSANLECSGGQELRIKEMQVL